MRGLCLKLVKKTFKVTDRRSLIVLRTDFVFAFQGNVPDSQQCPAISISYSVQLSSTGSHTLGKTCACILLLYLVKVTKVHVILLLHQKQKEVHCLEANVFQHR